MNRQTTRVAALAVLLAGGTLAFRANRAQSAAPTESVVEKVVSIAGPGTLIAVAPDGLTRDTVVFAGGCFWGVQAVFQHTNGVASALSGYAGGDQQAPSYEDVSTGDTGHAEAVRVIFDPSKVSYQTLMSIFFTVVHDPTQVNRQGPDYGTQYRSAVFTTDAAQLKQTEDFVASLSQAQVYSKPIATEIAPLQAFYPAESYHQDYATLHPNDMYIVINDAPKVVNLKKQFPTVYRVGIKQ